MTSEFQSGPSRPTGDAQDFEQPSPGGIMLRATYVGVVLFAILYFFRPEDFISPLKAVPMAKIAGIFTGAALVAAIFAEHIRLPKEAKWLLALFVWLCLTIPFSTWKGGSLDTVINSFAKMVLIAIAAMCSITTLACLRRLMLIQALAMLMMAGLSLTQSLRGERMFGVGEMFSDPNDFALNLCVVLPFCIAFVLSSRNALVKVFWIGTAGLMLLAIVSTYSRGGFLALLATIFMMARSFRVNMRTAVFVLVLGAGCVMAAIVVVGSSSYFERMKTITDVQADKTGSAQQRWGLLVRSVELSVRHPLFGVGPGQFMELSGAWHQTHNTYTQFSSEAGLPALVLFLILIKKTFRNLRQTCGAQATTASSYLVAALYCAITGYVVGAFFLGTAYLLLPYLLFAFAVSAQQLGVSEDVSGSWLTNEDDGADELTATGTLGRGN